MCVVQDGLDSTRGYLILVCCRVAFWLCDRPHVCAVDVAKLMPALFRERVSMRPHLEELFLVGKR